MMAPWRLFTRSHTKAKPPMVLRWSQTFEAQWTLKGQSDVATYEVEVAIEGPQRRFMTDVAPISEAIEGLRGKDLSTHIGKSSLEAVALHVRDLVAGHLEPKDRVKTVKVLENDLLAAELS